MQSKIMEKVKVNQNYRNTFIAGFSSFVFFSLLIACYFSDLLDIGKLFTNEPLHSSIETIGAVIALTVSGIIFSIIKNEDLTPIYHWVALALIGMSIIDIFHSFSSPGNLFVWLHSTATFVGGSFFMMVWIPKEINSKLKFSYIYLALLLVVICFSIGSILFPASTPQMIYEGSFTFSAKILNVLGGTFFLISAIHFFKESYSKPSHYDFIFGQLCLLFGLAGILFEESKLWDTHWWVWHSIRVLAYCLTIYFLLNLLSNIKLKQQYTNKLLYESNSRLKKEIEDHLQTQKTLQKNEELISNSKDLLYICDNQGNITFINKSFELFSGHKSEEFLGRSFATLFDERNLEIATHNYLKTLTGESPKFELSFKDTGIICEFENFPYFDQNGDIIGLMGSARDVTLRNQTRKELQKAKEKYSSLVLNSMGGFAYHKIVTDDNGQVIDYIFLEVNKNWEDYTGLKKEMVIGKKVTEIIPDIVNAQPNLLEIYGRVALENTREQYEFYFEPFKRYYSIKAYSIEIGYFAVLIDDITHSKALAEDLLLKNKELEQLALNEKLEKEKSESLTNDLQSIMHNLPDVFYRTDMQGIITMITPICEKAIGYTDKELLGTPMADLYFHPDERQKIAQAILDGNGTATRVEAALRNKKGERIWVSTNATVRKDAEGNPFCLEGIARNITREKDYKIQLQQANEEKSKLLVLTELERKKAESSLKDYQSILKNLPDVFYRTDMDGIITLITPICENEIGYTEEELIGTPLENLYYSPEERNKIVQAIIDGNGLATQVDAMLVTKKGEKIWVSSNAIVRTDEDGNHLCIEGIARNITRQKEFEINLQKANEDKSNLLSLAAHDLKSPLNNIHLLTQLIYNEIVDFKNPIIEENIKLIQQSSQEMQQLITDLLEMEQIESILEEDELEGLDLHFFIQKIVTKIKLQLKKEHLEIIFQCPERPLYVLGNRRWLEEVLVNLLSNSIKYSPYGGKIFLEVQVLGERVNCSISDQGLGVPVGDLDQLFQKFCRLSNRQPGSTGLGLYLVKKMMERMKGTIWLDKDYYEGAKFVIEFEKESA